MIGGSEEDNVAQRLGQSNLDQGMSISQDVELNAVTQATEEVKAEDSIDKEDNREYPSGVRLLIVTVGMMAVILMVALDNYILGQLKRPRLLNQPIFTCLT